MAVILDSSAVIAALNDEPGREVVDAALATGAGVSTVNLAEVVSILLRSGAAADIVRAIIAALPLTVIDLDEETACAAGAMAVRTEVFGLSLGDRVCLALGAKQRSAVLTTNRVWLRPGQRSA